MNYLIDTTIISEIRKGRRCDPKSQSIAPWPMKGPLRRDGLLAATTKIHRMALATGNTDDIADLDVSRLHPLSSDEIFCDTRTNGVAGIPFNTSLIAISSVSQPKGLRLKLKLKNVMLMISR